MKTKLLLLVIWMISLQSFAQNTYSTISVGYLQNPPQTQLNPQDWHYVAVTKSGLNGNIYIDGVLVSSSTYSNVPYIWNSLLLGATQGCVSCSPVPTYLGLIDEVRISNTVRTASEIQNNFNGNSPFASDANTLGLFHFDTNTGTSITNSTGGNNGVLYGGVAFGTGKFGLGLSFDGVDDYSRIIQSIPVNNMTIEFWYKSSDNEAVLAMMEYAYNTGIYLNTTSISCQVPTGTLANGMVAYYPFCGNANDGSVNANNGTVIGATLTSDRFGNLNSAYTFNGTSDYIQTNLTSILPVGNSSRSISYWMQSQSSQQYMTVLGYGNNNENYKDFHIWHNWNCNGINFNISNAASTYSTGNLNNNWNHFVLVFDNSLGINITNVKLYENGVLLSNICTTYGNGDIDTGNLYPLTIGKYHAVNLHYFNGNIDDIGLWNRALSQQEITNLFNNNLNPSITPQCWSEIATGLGHSGAIRPDGTLWTWGGDFNGELGNGTNSNFVSSPSQVGTEINWFKITCASYNTYAIKSDGTLWAWGANSDGQLGNGTNSDSNVPVQVGTDNNWRSVSAWQNYAIGLKSDGTIWSWGNNFAGQLGDGTNIGRNTPVQVGTNTNWKTISAGAGTSFGIKVDGTLWTWGFLSGTQSTINYLPIQVGTDNSWKDISAGGLHVIGLKNDGSIWTWGRNLHGELGDNTIVNNPIPTRVLSGTTWKSISAGLNFTMAVKTDGTLWGWGTNDFYQLGDGTQTEYRLPHQIGVFNDWTKVLIFSYTSYGFRNNDTWYWGNNIGNGTPIILSCDNLSTNENFITKNEITVYPNPTNSLIYVDSSNSGDILGNEIKIHNILGQEIYRSKLNEQVEKISLGSIAKSGLYIIHITDRNGKTISTKKVLLQ